MLALTLAVLPALLLSFTTAAEGNTSGIVCAGGSCQMPLNGNTVRNASVARVVCETDRGRNLGSGTLVELGDYVAGDSAIGYVLTCGHLFDTGEERAGAQETARITVCFSDGERFAARVLGIDRQWDLAVLKIARPRAVAVTIANDAPRPGEWLSSCGYGSDGRYWCNRGRVRGYVRPQGLSSFETLELSGMARQGDSGGPILNGRGELVAVLWGTDGRVVGGTYCGRIRSFLRRIFSGATGNTRRPVVPIRREGGSHSNGEKVQSEVVELLRQRLDGMQTRLDGSEFEEKARAVARDVARDVAGRIIEEYLARHGETSVAAWFPGLMTALGWTGPPAIAATVVITVLSRLLRRRVKKRLNKKHQPDTEERSETRRSRLNDSYAEQLAGVYALSGHSSVADATLGREYDKELRRAEQSSDGALATWASGLRKRVAQQFYRIHDGQPTPAEPVVKT